MLSNDKTSGFLSGMVSPRWRRTLVPTIACLLLAGAGLAVYFWAEKGKDSTYNDETVAIMRRVMKADSNAVDVGAFVGELTKPMTQIAPRGTIYAVEPQPRYAQKLRQRFPAVKVLECALGDHEGRTTFTLALDHPAYSGIKAQLYPTKEEHTQKIDVRIARLDDLVPSTTPISFIKIDVEGAEFMVLRGARATILRDRPVIAFEYGRTGIEEFGTKPEMMWTLLHDELGLEVTLMRTWLDGGAAFTAQDFFKMVDSGAEWMFVAYPAAKR